MVGRPTFLAFEMARRSIANSQFGLDTVGKNISNIETPGYTRQRLDQVSWSIGGTSKYVVNKSFYSGMGAMATGISQIRDPFLDARYRAESANFGEYVVTQSGLSDLRNIFDEIGTDTGLDVSMSDLLEAITKAQQEPTSKEYSMVVRAKADEFAKVLNRYNKELNNTRIQHLEDLEITVTDELNPILQEIAHLNEQITKMEVYGNPANELRDARNLLLDELSGFLDIQVREEAEQVTTDVTIHHMIVTIKGSGPPEIQLVNRDEYGSFGFRKTADGKGAQLTMTDVKMEEYSPKEMEDILQKGALRAYLDIINGDGGVAADGGINPRGIPFAQSYLDNMAKAFAKAMNDINTGIVKIPGGVYVKDPGSTLVPGDPGYPEYLSELDANGNLVPILFQKDEDGNPVPDPDVDPSDPSYPVYLRYQYLEENPSGEDVYGSYLIVNSLDTTKYGKVLDPSASANDPAHADYDPLNPVYITDAGGKPVMFELDANGNPVLSDPMDPTSFVEYDPYKNLTAANISISNEWRFDEQEIIISAPNNDTANVIYDTRFYDALNNSKYSLITGQTPLTFQEAVSSFQAILGLDLSTAQSLLDASETVLLTLDDQRQSISGVSENEEAVTMMMYSNHYNAAVRYMTTLDEALNTVINNMGLVGR